MNKNSTRFDCSPKPGLNGNYDGACTLCLRPTDTGIAFKGEAEFHIGALIRLGLPKDEAVETYRAVTGSDPGKVFAGVSTVVFRVCELCATGNGFARPALLAGDGEVPCYFQAVAE